MIWILIALIVIIVVRFKYEPQFDIIFINGKKYLIVWYWCKYLNEIHRNYKIITEFNGN